MSLPHTDVPMVAAEVSRFCITSEDVAVIAGKGYRRRVILASDAVGFGRAVIDLFGRQYSPGDADAR